MATAVNGQPSVELDQLADIVIPGTLKAQASTRVGVPCLLITANVGTVFEKPDLLDVYIETMTKTIRASGAKFVAIHYQEIGGKDFAVGMQNVQPVFERLTQHPNMPQGFTRSFAIVDSDFTSKDNFTALSNQYLVAEDVDAALFDFEANTFVPFVCSMHDDHSTPCASPLYRREKFPASYFPQVTWGRKGYCHTRWQLNGRSLDLVNVHFFHDASNLVAHESTPSVYAQNRRNALRHTVKHLSEHVNEEGTAFIFGDFNFRLDVSRVVEQLATDLHAKHKHVEVDAESKPHRIVLKGAQGEEELLVMTQKKFKFSASELMRDAASSTYQALDVEGKPLPVPLSELPIQFSPTYPYAEDASLPTTFLSKRCPGWCDRILMTKNAQELLTRQQVLPDAYSIIGDAVCMGDHKPVKLAFVL
eukprot:m.13608 g.13608  ORF g.13608 m.13608 type:complete len:419 (+) comp5968_c0_seq1:456-1712(+)